MRRSFLLALLAFAVACLFMAATPAMAVHKGAGGVLTCGFCHTMHSSQGDDTSIGGTDGSLVLLRGGVTDRGDIHLLCLQCHSEEGDNADFDDPNSDTPPKVHFETTGGVGAGTGSNSDPFDFKGIGAGGDFGATFSYDGTTFTLNPDGDDANDGYTLGHGHSLGATIEPPGAATGDAGTIDLSCTSCHDPHGVDGASTATVNRYRYLRVQVVGGGGGTALDDDSTTLTDESYLGEIAGDFTGTGAGGVNHFWPVYDGTTNNIYRVSSLTSQSAGISGWCSQCHDKWHEEETTGNESSNDWKRHPVANELVDASTGSGAGVDIVRWAHYNERAGVSNAPYTNTTGTKLPAAQTDDGDDYFADTSADAVFCLSCHYAHGGPNFDNLRWDYTSTVSFGEQTGNSIESNEGCQQCHNR
jgi:cytochrome c553